VRFLRTDRPGNGPAVKNRAEKVLQTQAIIKTFLVEATLERFLENEHQNQDKPGSPKQLVRTTLSGHSKN
jgi:hypothetical protein